MAVYDVTHSQSPISRVEFTPVADGNLAFFLVKDPARLDAVKDWLQSQAVGQSITAETALEDGVMLVTHGPKNRKDMMETLAAHGEPLQLHKHKRTFSDIAWKVRGSLGFAGQSLQLGSSFMTKKGFSWDTGMFAALNLAANAMAIAFGAQRRPDTHKLHAIKNDVNETLENAIAAGESLPSMDERYADDLAEPSPPKNAAQKMFGWMKDNSVVLGEVGLRFAAGLAMAFPVNRWLFESNAAGKLQFKLNTKWFDLVRSGELKTAFNKAKNPIPLLYWGSVGSLTGKGIALAAKAEDPYDPKQKNWWDTVREKYLFRIGGNLEAVSFSAQTYSNFTSKEPSKMITFRGKESPNFIAGIGTALFTGGYIVRNWAKFGVKELDTPEMYAHAAKALSATKPEELPQLIADTAATLKKHFPGDAVPYSELYGHLHEDLYRFHQVAVPVGASVDTPATGEYAEKHAKANPPRIRTDDTARRPAASHADKLAQAAAMQKPAYGLTA